MLHAAKSGIGKVFYISELEMTYLRHPSRLVVHFELTGRLLK